MTEIELRGEYITLGQLVKLAGPVGSGGIIKNYLADGLVRVNGEREIRRGRKLRSGDVITLANTDQIRLT